MEGADKARAWLKGLKANAKIYRNNVAILSAVNSGEIETGIIYHYYWYRDQAESGANSKNVQLEFFGHKDPGAFCPPRAPACSSPASTSTTRRSWSTT